VTTSDLPAEGQPDVSNEGTEAPFDDVITLSTSTSEDGVVTVTVVGEVDTFTAPVLRSTLDSQLEQQPRELVIDLSGVSSWAPPASPSSSRRRSPRGPRTSASGSSPPPARSPGRSR